MAQDYIMWVGKCFYPSIDDFVDEASKMGVSKRTNVLPHDMAPGESRVWLIHDTAITGRDPKTKQLRENVGKIFGFFVVSHVDYLVDDVEKVKEIAERNKGLPIHQVTSEMRMAEQERGCGFRVPGGFYLIGHYGEEDFEILEKAAKEIAEAVDIRGGLVVLKDPIPYPYVGRKFRGFKKYDAEEIFKDIRISIPNIDLVTEKPTTTITKADKRRDYYNVNREAINQRRRDRRAQNKAGS